MLAKETHTVFVAYGEQQYESQTDFKALAESTETSVQDSFRELLPWVYQVRNPNGRLLSDGLVYPDQDSQEVTVELADAYIGHSNEAPSILLVAAGTIDRLNQSLFTEEVIDPSLHPFYPTVELLVEAQQDLSDTYGSTQWLTGTMLTAGAWTGVSLALANGESEGAGFWESQAVAGALLTVPMVAIWMNEKLPSGTIVPTGGTRLYAELMAMNGTPVSFEELTPKPGQF